MKRQLFPLILLAALPFAAQSEEISYTYLEAGYSRLDSGIDADGWGANGSFAFTPNLHLFGGYSQNQFDDSDFDLNIATVGLGYALPVNERLHLLARGGYENFDPDFFNDTGTGFIEAGARGTLGAVEGWALAGYQDGNDFDSEIYGRLGVQVKFSPRWGVVGEVKLIDNDEQYFVGPRLSF